MLPSVIIIFIFVKMKIRLYSVLTSKQIFFVKTISHSILSINRPVGSFPILVDVRSLLACVGFVDMAFAVII